MTKTTFRKKEEPVAPEVITSEADPRLRHAPEGGEDQMRRMQVRPMRTAPEAGRPGARAQVQPHQQTPSRTAEAASRPMSAKDLIVGIGEVALVATMLPLVIVGSLSGCGPAEAAPTPSPPAQSSQIPAPPASSSASPQTRPAPRNEDLHWFPAFIVRNGQLADVSVGYTDETMPQGLQTYPWAGGAPQIPQGARDEGRTSVNQGVDFSRFFFRDSVFGPLVGNDVFFAFPGSDSGGSQGGVGGYRILGPDGREMAACFEGCPEYQQAISLGAQGGGHVIFHELLHDAWGSVLSDDQRSGFLANARTFFNALGSDWRSDALIGAIYRGIYYTSPEAGNTDSYSNVSFTPLQQSSAELDAWAAERLGPLDQATRDSIKGGIAAFLRIHSDIFFDRTYRASDDDRANFLNVEGFTYTAAGAGNLLQEVYEGKALSGSRWLPQFLSGAHRTLLREELVDQLAEHGGGYFDSAERFAQLRPYLADFASWMVSRHPELQQFR